MATVHVKRGETRVTGADRPADPLAVRQRFGLARRQFARLLGVSESTLARWERSGKLPRNAPAKIARVANVLQGLSRVIPKADLNGWLDRPNEACRSADAPTPADLMEKGHYDKVEAMIYFFESGVAY